MNKHVRDTILLIIPFIITILVIIIIPRIEQPKEVKFKMYFKSKKHQIEWEESRHPRKGTEINHDSH
jgi:hypothetical protein